ncbi:hypothetical protein V6N13_092334 [Hibiscus sabdariffa]|uniref:Uncharacterized protein n=1 Tax=Hibiscus sabdariffa TaxID=183260 RepID=A0ABR2CC19_9ROSI
METKWPNLINGYSNEGFWELEWMNHGMCSDYPQHPLIYFNITLNLAENHHYDPLSVLGVPPSNTNEYEIDTLLENVKRNVGFYPQISCNRPLKGGKLYLQEVRFCFTRATPPTELQDCPDKMDNVCRLVPPQQRKVTFSLPITAISGHNATWEALASA